MKCEICGNDVQAAIKPQGSDKLHCAVCNEVRRAERLTDCSNATLCAKFNRLDEQQDVKHTTELLAVRPEQVNRINDRIETGCLRCVKCKRRSSLEDQWQDTDFPKGEI